MYSISTGKTIYLVGMMGAGKTTVGRKLAKALGLPFVDLDHFIEEQTGVSVATIFEIEGERGFRQREAQALWQQGEQGNVVVASGGGAVLDPLNRAFMAASGMVVYLQATPESLYARTRHDKNRPLLLVTDPLARIRTLVAQRDPLYREIADIVVESSGTIGSTVQAIQKAFERTWQS